MKASGDSHVAVDGRTSIGRGTHVFPFVSIGLAPQDLKYGGEETATGIGEENQIREFVTIHRGTAGGGGVTRVGDRNLLMAQAHVAHDCQIGSDVIMANAATLAGHVEIATGRTSEHIPVCINSAESAARHLSEVFGGGQGRPASQ